MSLHADKNHQATLVSVSPSERIVESYSGESEPEPGLSRNKKERGGKICG